MELEIYIIISIFSGAGGGGLLYLLLKTYLTERIRREIKFDYDVKFESAKSDIKHEYDLKFESARKALEKKATEHQIQYSKLHIDRSEKLREIYQKLIEGEKSLENLTTLGQGPEWTKDGKREQVARDRLEELRLLILQNRIFFKADLCQMLDKVTYDYNDVIVKMNTAKFIADHENRTGQREREEDSPLRQWMNQRDRVNNEIVRTRESIEDEFRKILGV